MKLETEIVEEKQKALIVCGRKYAFIDHLKKQLHNHSVESFFSSNLPPSFKNFRYCFLVNENVSLNKISDLPEIHFVLIYINKKPPLQLTKSNLKNIKVIFADEKRLNTDDIDKILWFSFSKTKEIYLRLHHFEIKKERNKFITNLQHKTSKFITRKNFMFSVLFLIVTIHLFFVPFLIGAAYYSYRSLILLKEGDFLNLPQEISQGKKFNAYAKNYFGKVRPTYLFLGFSLLPENTIDLVDRSLEISNHALVIIKNSRVIQSLLLKQNKSEGEKSEFRLRLDALKKNLNDLEANLSVFSQKIPSFIPYFSKFKQKIFELSDNSDKIGKIIEYSERALTNQKTSKYLIFFANNMELRPGGGFLGSFGILEIGNYNIGDIKIYDVYDADGQLTAHIDPPKPISQYLNIPHWFLRDSNFSPDFYENYEKALFFLEKEMGFKDFDGAILVTTTAVENIVSAYGNLYLPDYKETINAKNMYLKTQLYTEKDFFPGSIQKRVFLSSLFRQLIINFETASVKQLAEEIKKSLDTKQIIVYLNDRETQTFFDSLFWSGRVIEPKCSTSRNDCLLDYLFPYDANVGANKANFFVNRYYNLKINIDRRGVINHLLSIQYKNESPSEIFPTGHYRNYFQLLLPKNVLIKEIVKDGTLIENYDEEQNIFKKIGFYFEVPPKKTVEIKISYQSLDKIQKGSNIYQLIVQKQIGAKNSDLIMEFGLNDRLSVLNKNFSPIVKGREIFYNTVLTTDKIFLIELLNE